MKKLSLLILLVFLIGCEQEIKTFDVVGDLTEDFAVEVYAKENFKSMKFEDKRYEVLDAKAFYDALPLVYETNKVCFESFDGFMNQIEASTLEDTYLGYRDERWYFLSEKHPPNSGIKNIKEMIIVKDTEDVDHAYGLNIVNAETGTTQHYSIGELYLQPYRMFKYVDGISEKETGGYNYEVAALKVKRTVQVKDLVEDDYQLSLMMTDEGDYEYFTEEGYVELLNHSLNYFQHETYDVYNGLKGIIINPPILSTLDVYEDVINNLDERFLIIFIDGFSHEQLSYLRKDVSLKLWPCEKANTVFKPVTNAGFAAMITGQPPKINGVLNRDYRELKTMDIFEYAQSKGYSTALVEGDIKILDTSIEPILNLDKNNNGYTDDEIHQAALEELNNDLVMVHYHSVDEYGHQYGMNHEKTIEQLKLINYYVEELISNWTGNIIITSDHGMHNTLDGGNHGEFRYEDLIVPYYRGKYD